MTQMKTKFILATLLLVVFANAVFSQSFDKAKLDQLFDTLAAKDKAMGSLTVAKDGNVIYSRAVGYSKIDGATKTPATATTRYRIGSISKMFTAVMILQLVEEGKLKLTDTIDKFYPTVPNAAKITVGNLLNHRSGIHNFTSDAEYLTYMTQPKTEAEMLAIIVKGKPDFEPNAKADYSNSNYVLLSYIIEKLDGKTYGEALKTRITSKINLSDTYLGGKTNVANNESYSYRFSGSWKQESETDMSIPIGAGAIVSTPTDLTKFIDALFNLKLISAESLKQMQTMTEGYGMGMFQYPVGGKISFGHTGGIDGFNSKLAYLPEEKIAVAYTSNGTIYPVKDIVSAAFIVALNQNYVLPAFDAIALKSEDLDKFLGVYSSPTFPLKITVTKKDATLYTQATGQSEFPVEATAADKFKFDAAGIVLEFDTTKNQMTIKQGGRQYVLTKE